MGLSLLTRYSLFMESSQFIEGRNAIIQFRDLNSVRDMYLNSARLIRGFEDIINDEDGISPEEYQSRFEGNSADIPNEMVQRIRELMQKQLGKKKENQNELPFKTFFVICLKLLRIIKRR